MRSASVFTLLSLALPFVFADSHGHNARRHHNFGKRASSEHSLHKRFGDARLTFYDVGLGACGKTNKPSDFVVAINSAQYGSGGDCGKQITITVGGKSISATIVDECPSCPENGLDLSKAAFDALGSEDAGVLTGSWAFGSGGGDDGDDDHSSSTSSTHKTTSTKEPETTTSKTSTTSSSTSTKTSSTTTSHKTSSTTSTSSTRTTSSTSVSATPTTTSINYSSGEASGLAIPTGVLGSGTVNNINDFNQAFVGLAAMIVAGADSNN